MFLLILAHPSCVCVCVCVCVVVVVVVLVVARCRWFVYIPAVATVRSSLASLNLCMVYLSGARLSRLSWKIGRYSSVCLLPSVL